MLKKTHTFIAIFTLMASIDIAAGDSENPARTHKQKQERAAHLAKMSPAEQLKYKDRLTARHIEQQEKMRTAVRATEYDVDEKMDERHHQHADHPLEKRAGAPSPKEQEKKARVAHRFAMSPDKRKAYAERIHRRNVKGAEEKREKERAAEHAIDVRMHAAG